ncbi:uncharacterized protein DEA37_0006882 [Paragonimus westermani]|uniref:Saposin B-type domain-containing protein n=1 Tax=Paragonimus westermani TaxID=34504 RepID=A0A5J4NKK6_9TREM|nr:uncharacterized protein DEA37_0006882 [Paragonimus westermani]
MRAAELRFQLLRVLVCRTCETIADLLKDELLNDKARSVVERRIVELCQKIPAKELSDGFPCQCCSYDFYMNTFQCVKFVEKSVDPLVVRLATDLEPEALCTAIKLCDES